MILKVHARAKTCTSITISLLPCSAPQQASHAGGSKIELQGPGAFDWTEIWWHSEELNIHLGIRVQDFPKIHKEHVADDESIFIYLSCTVV